MYRKFRILIALAAAVPPAAPVSVVARYVAIDGDDNAGVNSRTDSAGILTETLHAHS